MIGGAPIPGPPGPAGDQGDPGASGEFAPLAPSAIPNPHTAEYLLRVSVGKMFQITLRGHIVNRDPPSITDRKIASFEKVATIKANAAGNVATPLIPLVDIRTDIKQTGLGGMSTASMVQAVAPGDPASLLITLSGPTGTICGFEMYSQTDDGIDL